MLYTALLVAAAVIPAVVLLRYVYLHDTVEKEPPALLWKLAILGALSGIVAGVLEMLGSSALSGVVNADSEIYSMLYAFLIVAVAEEGVKFLVLKSCTWRNSAFNYRYDGIVYAVFVSLGFAILENIGYVFSYGLGVAFSRALLAIPAHAGFAVFMGSFYGRAKVFEAYGMHGKSVANQWTGYIIAVLLHGFYDACAMSGSNLSVLVFFGFVIAMDVVVIRMVKHESRTDEQI